MKVYSVDQDTSLMGRDIFVGRLRHVHRYAPSGVMRLNKLTVKPSGWGKFSRARKVGAQIYVTFADAPRLLMADDKDLLDVMNVRWYPLKELRRVTAIES